MKTTLIVITLLLYSSLIAAQSIIEGQLINSKEEPLPFVSLILINVADSGYAEGSISDSEGKFTITNVPNGNYFLIGSFIGFKTDTLSSIELNSPGTLKLGNLVLVEESIDLKEVTVTANKQQYEIKQDRIVLNVASFPSMSGNTGLEVLQKTPGLIVNKQDNSIIVPGKGEVMVMINNKVQRIPKEVLMARLQSIRAENIESIEVIHQPPAKYDASGAAGMINIVLKENGMEGSNGTATAMLGYGQREKAGLSLNLNSRRKKLNWYGDYSFNHNRTNDYQLNHFREYEFQGNQHYYENYVTLRNYRESQHAGNMGLDAELGSNTIIGVLLGVSTSKQVWAKNGDSQSAGFTNGDLTSKSSYLTDSETDMNSISANANIFQKIGPGSLNANIDYVKINYTNSGNLLDKEDPDHYILFDRPTPIQFWILSLDYESKLSDKWILETGIKGTFNDTFTNTEVESSGDEYWENSTILGKDRSIQERIYAAYLSFDGTLSEKFSTELGLRFENYDYQFLSPSDQTDFNKTFSNPFPIIRFDYQKDSINSFQLGFNRSITRPSFYHLTSFLLLFDPSLIIHTGPQLRPTFTNTFKLSWQHHSLLLSLSYLDRKDQIYFYNTVDKEDGLQTSTPANLDHEEIFETSLFIPWSPYSWWEMTWNLNAYYHYVKDISSHPLLFEKDIFSYSFQINSTFLLANGFSIGLDGMYRSHYLVGDQIQYNWPYLNLAFQKTLTSGGSLSISIQDIFNSSGKREWEYHQPELGIRTFGDRNFSERQIRITYTHSFGNLKLKNQRQRETGASDVKKRM